MTKSSQSSKQSQDPSAKKSGKATLRQALRLRAQGRVAQGKLTMADLLAQTGYSIPSLKRGQEVNGKIISISHEEVLIDIEAKSEGIVAGRELSYVRDLAAKLSVGDSVDATVLYPENDAGQVVLSLRKHSGEKRWTELENMWESGEEVGVVVLEANRGGIICDFWGIRGFLPASQLTQLPSRLNDLIGKTLSVRVIEVDRATNRLILSQRRSDTRDIKKLLKLLARVNIGDKFEGIVSAVLPFGIFVEIDVEEAGPAVSSSQPTSLSITKSKSNQKQTSRLRALAGTPSADVTRDKVGNQKLEGLVHISEISWEKIEDLTKLFKVGDKVDVLVAVKDKTTGRLSLSIKQLTEDPFLEITGKYSKDQSISGTVAKITAHGVFVALEGGLEGFVPVAKIPLNQSWELGRKVECIVDSVDTRARLISLVPDIREKPILYR